MVRRRRAAGGFVLKPPAGCGDDEPKSRQEGDSTTQNIYIIPPYLSARGDTVWTLSQNGYLRLRLK